MSKTTPTSNRLPQSTRERKATAVADGDPANPPAANEENERSGSRAKVSRDGSERTSAANRKSTRRPVVSPPEAANSPMQRSRPRLVAATSERPSRKDGHFEALAPGPTDQTLSDWTLADERWAQEPVREEAVPLLSDDLVHDETPPIVASSPWVLAVVNRGALRTSIDRAAFALRAALREDIRLAKDPRDLRREDAAVFVWLAVSDVKSTDVEVRKFVDTLAEVPKIALLDSLQGDRHFLRRTLRKLGLPVLVTLDELNANNLEAALEHARDLARVVTTTHETRERFALALRCAQEGFWEWDLRTHQFFLSERGREILGYDRNFVASSPEDWLCRLEAGQRQHFRHELAQFCRSNGEPMLRECKIRWHDGTQRWILLNMAAQLDERGAVTRVCGALTDISSFRHRELELRERYRKDPTTQLARAEVFYEQLARALELNKNYPDSGFSVVLIEIHGLATVNASLGVERGSSALQVLAQRVSGKLRPEDHLYRLGTQQLVALLIDDQEETEALALAAHVRRCCAEAIELPGQRVHLRTSIGITSSSRGYSSVDDVLADVNAAASHSKHSGRNVEQRFDLSMRDSARQRLRLEAELRDAVKQPHLHFELQYQPIVELKNTRVTGFESLIRWRHPELGVIAPARFIPLAEATGLIIELGRWAIHRAAHQLAQWQTHPLLRDLMVNVNLSARQSADPELLFVLESALSRAKLRAGSLKIELTESAVLDEPDRFRHLAHAIRSLGVPILIDDFGTGFASLSYLQRLPIDGLKIDKSFIDRLGSEKTSTTLVQSMVTLGQRLEIDVVAEGVEEDEQRRILLQADCGLAQGYFFGKPQWPGDVLERALAGRAMDLPVKRDDNVNT